MPKQPPARTTVPNGGDIGGTAQRADEDRDLGAGLERGELPRRRPDDEEDGRDRPPFRVPVGDGEGDALALLVGHDDDELSGTAFPGHLGGVDLDEVEVGHQTPSLQDLGHHRPRTSLRLFVSLARFRPL